MSGDTLSGAELVKIKLIELKTIVSPEFPCLSPNLVFYKGFELLEHGKSFVFLPQKINPNSSKKIIHKGQHIAFSTKGRNSRWTPQVRINIIEGAFSTMCCYRETDSLLFPKNIMITEIKFTRAFAAKKISLA